jgi:hypothetical protein
MRIVEYEVDHGGGRGPETVRWSHVTGIYDCSLRVTIHDDVVI